MKYLIVLEPADDGSWWVRVPDLPGCFSWGATREQATTNAREAIAGHIEALREVGDEVPDGLAVAQRIEIVEVSPAVR
jgi:antitoxin HicB